MINNTEYIQMCESLYTYTTNPNQIKVHRNDSCALNPDQIQHITCSYDGLGMETLKHHAK